MRSEGHPAAVFTGGSLLYGTVGRTDLISADQTEALTRSQFRSARRLAAALDDTARLYPTHGFGSFCASAKSEGDSDGTVGAERKVNLALTVDDEDKFVERLVAGLTAYPRYYAHMGPMNLAGAVPVDLSPPAAVDPVELTRRIHRGDWVVDLRQRRLFAADHIAGTIGIELGDPFATYLGWLIPWGTPLTLLGDTPTQVAAAQRQLVRIGIDRPSGAATGGPERWSASDDHRNYPVVDFAQTGRAGGGDRPRRPPSRRASHELHRRLPPRRAPGRRRSGGPAARSTALGALRHRIPGQHRHQPSRPRRPQGRPHRRRLRTRRPRRPPTVNP